MNFTRIPAVPQDALFFVEDDKPASDAELLIAANPWNILIIDDDPDVHSATMFAPKVQIQGRGLNFLHAYSTAEARQALLHSKRIAVILF